MLEYTLFICMPLLFIIPVIKTLFLTIVLPGFFLMMRLECCRKKETVIFATRNDIELDQHDRMEKHDCANPRHLGEHRR